MLLPMVFRSFLDNIADLKTCNQTEKYLTELETKLQDVVNASVKVELTSGTLLTSAQMLLRLGLPLVILVGTTLLIGGGIDFFYLFTIFAGSIKGI